MKNRKKLIIALLIMIPIILIITFVSVWNYNPSFQMLFSGKDMIRHTYEEYEGGSNEIFISEKDGQLYIDVYGRDSNVIYDVFLGELGEHEGKPEKRFESYSLEGYEPEGSAMTYIFEQQVLNGRIDSKIKTMLIQKADENAKEAEKEIGNYIVKSEIIEHKGNKYQLFTAERIINHDIDNFGLEEMKEFIKEINK